MHGQELRQMCRTVWEDGLSVTVANTATQHSGRLYHCYSDEALTGFVLSVSCNEIRCWSKEGVRSSSYQSPTPVNGASLTDTPKRRKEDGLK